MADKDNLIQQFARICSSKNIIEDPIILKEFSIDLSFLKGKIPKFLIKISKANQVIDTLKLANALHLSIIPISSPSKLKHH